MNISGFRPEEDFYIHNSTRSAEVCIPDKVQAPCADAAYVQKDEGSTIGGQDTQKVLMELKEDQVLQQYQYFIGSGALKPGADISAPERRSGEGFTL